MSYLRVRRTTRCSQKISRRILYGEKLDFKLAVTDRSNPCQGVLEPTEYLGLTAGMEWSFSIRRLIPKASRPLTYPVFSQLESMLLCIFLTAKISAECHFLPRTSLGVINFLRQYIEEANE